jgi:ADP-heptose:LPS heptosyltransferase
MIDSIKKVITKNLNDRRYIIIHPGSGGSSIDWPLKNFIHLIKLLNDWGKYEVAVTGVTAEKVILDPLYQSDVIIFDSVGVFDLIELSVFLKKSDLFISNSTGPLHLAVAMGTKILGIYPNSSGLGPGRWGPFGHSSLSYLTPAIEQAKSRTDPINNDMDKITPEIVFERIKEIL